MERSFDSATANNAGRTIYTLTILAVTAAVLLSFHFMYGYPVGDSTRFNVPWAVAFSDQFWSGDWFPRWLIDYPQHVGGPVFYFYGPVPFFIVAAIKGVFPGLSPTAALTVLHGLFYFASGLAFYIWAGRYTHHRYALIGACLYMSAPYHILDLEFRNALGEAMTYIYLPLIFRYLLDTDERGGRWLWGSVAYAGLIASHLPSALLAAPFMVLAAGAFYRSTPWKGVGRLAVCGVGGALLSGPYLLPALLLRDWLPSNAWSYDTSYWPETWLLPQGFFYKSGGIFYGAIFATMFVAVLLHAIGRLCHRHERQRSSADTWAIVALISLAMIIFLTSTPSTLLWTYVGPLRNVQFPFRLGVVSDFMSATLIVLALPRIFTFVRLRVRPAIHVLTVALVGVLVTNLVVFTDLVLAYAIPEPSLRTNPLTCCVQAPEYWLSSTLHSRLFSRLGSRSAYQLEANTFAPVLAERSISKSEQLLLRQAGGRLILESNLIAPTDVRIGQAYVPQWQMSALDDGEALSLRPDPETGLITATLPAGRHRYALFLRETPAEALGKWAGLAGLLLLAGLAVFSYRNRAQS